MTEEDKKVVHLNRMTTDSIEPDELSRMPELHIRTGYGGEDTPYLDLKIEVADVIDKPRANTYPYQTLGYMEACVVDFRNVDRTVEEILDDVVVSTASSVDAVKDAWNEMNRFDWNLQKICFVLKVSFDQKYFARMDYAATGIQYLKEYLTRIDVPVVCVMNADSEWSNFLEAGFKRVSDYLVANLGER